MPAAQQQWEWEAEPPQGFIVPAPEVLPLRTDQRTAQSTSPLPAPSPKKPAEAGLHRSQGLQEEASQWSFPASPTHDDPPQPANPPIPHRSQQSRTESRNGGMQRTHNVQDQRPSSATPSPSPLEPLQTAPVAIQIPNPAPLATPPRRQAPPTPEARREFDHNVEMIRRNLIDVPITPPRSEQAPSPASTQGTSATQATQSRPRLPNRNPQQHQPPRQPTHRPTAQRQGKERFPSPTSTRGTAREEDTIQVSRRRSGGSAVPGQVYERGMEWRRSSLAKGDKMRQDKHQGEVEMCTFAPKINRNRLYQNSYGYRERNRAQVEAQRRGPEGGDNLIEAPAIEGELQEVSDSPPRTPSDPRQRGVIRAKAMEMEESKGAEPPKTPPKEREGARSPSPCPTHSPQPRPKPEGGNARRCSTPGGSSNANGSGGSGGGGGAGGLDDPGERLHEDAKLRALARKQKHMQRREDELKECTFTPTTNSQSRTGQCHPLIAQTRATLRTAAPDEAQPRRRGNSVGACSGGRCGIVARGVGSQQQRAKSPVAKRALSPEPRVAPSDSGIEARGRAQRRSSIASSTNNNNGKGHTHMPLQARPRSHSATAVPTSGRSSRAEKVILPRRGPPLGGSRYPSPSPLSPGRRASSPGGARTIKNGPRTPRGSAVEPKREPNWQHRWLSTRAAEEAGHSPTCSPTHSSPTPAPVAHPQHQKPRPHPQSEPQPQPQQLNQAQQANPSSSKESWTAFQIRQQQTQDRKQQRVQRILEEESKRMGRPQINEKSKELMEDTRGTFLDRVSAYATCRSAQASPTPTAAQPPPVRSPIAHYHPAQALLENVETNGDSPASSGNSEGSASRCRRLPPKDPEEEECTFRPRITQEAKQREGRGVDALCYEDALRRNVIREKGRREQDQHDLEGCTFTPRVSKTNGKGKPNTSKMVVGKQPDKYGEWIGGYQKKKVERERQAALERQQREMEQCTFQPHIHDVPGYVFNSRADRSESEEGGESTSSLADYLRSYHGGASPGGVEIDVSDCD